MAYCTTCDLSVDGQYCSNCGSPLKPAITNEQELTVFFSDLQNSSSVAADFNLSDAEQILRTYHDILESAISSTGGEVAQIAGDDFLAYFDSGPDSQHEVEAAVTAALIAIRRIQARNLDGSFPVPARVAIHCGPTRVFTATNGEKQFAGLTPIIAARLQRAAEPNTVVVSKQVADHLGTSFSTHRAGSLRLKGTAQSIEYLEVRRSTEAARGLTKSHGTTKFVGREHELKVLGRLWKKSKTATEIVAIRGEPGIGKTRLIREYANTVDQEPIHCKCEPQGKNQPMQALLQMVHSLPIGSTPEERLKKILRLAPALSNQEDMLQTLSGLLADTAVEVLETANAISQLFGGTSLQPLILIDDVQWIDDFSLSVVLELKNRQLLPGGLIVLSARPEFVANDLAELTLTPLSLDEITELSEQYISPRHSKAVADQLLRQTNGNPLYVEQLSMTLRETVLANTSGLILEEDIPSKLIPASLTDLLISRIESAGEYRRLLQSAAVLGTQFETALLEKIYPKDRQTINQELAELAGINLMAETIRGKCEFRHGLIRDAAYATLLQRDKFEIHQRAARALEQRKTARPLELIAFHWDKGNQKNLATSYYAQAAEQNISRSFHHEARLHSERGLALISTHPPSDWKDQTTYSLLTVLGNALSVLEHYGTERRFEVSESLLALSEQLDRKDIQLLPALYARWTYHLALCDSSTIVWAERIRELALNDQSETGPDPKITSQFAVGTTLFMEGKIQPAIMHLEGAIALYEPADHRRFMELFGEDHGLYASVWLQWAYALAGQVEKALAQCRYSHQLAAHLDDSLAKALALTYETHVLMELDELDLVLEKANELGTLAAEFELGYYKTISAGITDRARARLQKFIKERPMDVIYAETSEFIKTTEQKLLMTTIHRDFLVHFLKTGDLKAAQQEHDLAQRLFEETFERNFVPEFLFLQAEIFRLNHARDDALTHYQECISMAQSQGAHLFAVKAAAAIAEIHLCQNEPQQARQLLEPYLDLIAEPECELQRQHRDLLTRMSDSQ